MGNGGIRPRLLTLGPEWRRVIFIARLLYHYKKFVVTVRQKAIWALEHVWKIGEEKTVFASTGDRNAIILSSIL